MKKSNDAVKQAGAWFIANLIHNQYKQTVRTQLIELVKEEFALSKTFTLRKCFIKFCVAAVNVMSFEQFRTHFFDLYLKLAEDKIQDVRIAFLNSVCTIRPFLELDTAALNDFNVCLNNFMMEQSTTIFELTNQVDMKLLKMKRQANFGASKK